MSKQNLFDDALKAEGVTGPLATLARSIYAQESGSGRNTKTSNAGARGGMQIIPSTFAGVADKGWSIDDPMHNARAGIRYLKQLDKKAGGDPALTAAGYYGGPGGLEKARKGIAVSDPRNPHAPNTLEYGQQVVARMGGDGTKAAAASPGPSLDVAPPVPMAVGVPLSAEFLAAVSPNLGSAMNQSAEANAWQAFLRAMPQGKQPVRVEDIDYSNPQPAVNVPRFQFNPTPATRPNFAAFSGFGKRV